MKIVAAADGPPYPYPHPLPDEAKHVHLDASRACQRRTNDGNGLVFFPGIVLVIVSLFWGRTRSADPGDESLWESAPLAAAILMFGGAALIVAGVLPIIVHARRKGTHTRLLEDYGVRLNPSKTRELADPSRAS